MGGHGGLNILPQKKWNVYNWDNRVIVERDKKKAADKKRKEEEELRARRNQDRKDTLLQDKGIKPKVQQQVEKEEKGYSSLANNELSKIMEKKKHVNLFQHEQRLIDNKEERDAKMMRIAKELEQKDIDMSSKFLGVYDHKKPWYVKTASDREAEQRDRMERRQLKETMRRREVTARHKNKVASIDANSQHIVEELTGVRERSREKYCDIKEQAKPMSKIEAMRMERLKREEKEKRRQNELINNKCNTRL